MPEHISAIRIEPRGLSSLRRPLPSPLARFLTGTTGSVSDLGMSTAEYALGTVTAVAFAGVLYVILTGGTVSEVLTELVVDALNSGP